MNIGDKMPEVLGKDSNGKDVKLSDFPGMNFIIYFYPKDSWLTWRMEKSIPR